MWIFDIHILLGFSATYFNPWAVDVWAAFFIHQHFRAKVHIKLCLFVFSKKNKSAICFLYWLHFLIDKQLKAEIHMPVFFQNTCHRLCVDSNFLPWKFTSEMFFDSINFIHGNCTAEVSINSCLFFFNQQITMSFFVDSIFSPIEISRQRFTSNPALEVLFCKSTKSMCLKNIYTSTSYILVSWFFLQNIFGKTVFPFYALFGGKIGSYQGRIRAVSEPYQSRIRAKLKIFHFFLGDWIFFLFFSLLCSVFTCVPWG